jgi:hypothetical protein
MTGELVIRHPTNEVNDFPHLTGQSKSRVFDGVKLFRIEFGSKLLDHDFDVNNAVLTLLLGYGESTTRS